MKNKKEDFVEHTRAIIGNTPVLGWIVMQKAVRFFEELCIPGRNVMPDDPIMTTPKMDDPACMWAYIRSIQAQAEQGNTHHDYAEVIDITLVATAKVLSRYPSDDKNVDAFQQITNMTPMEFIQKYA